MAASEPPRTPGPPARPAAAPPPVPVPSPTAGGLLRIRLRTLLVLVALCALAFSGLDGWLKLRERWKFYERQAAYHARLEQDFLKQQQAQGVLVPDILKIDAQIERTMTVFSPGQVAHWKDAEAVFVEQVRQEAAEKAAVASRQALYHARKRQEFQTRWW